MKMSVNRGKYPALSLCLWAVFCLSLGLLLLSNLGFLRLVHSQKLAAVFLLAVSGYAASYLQIAHMKNTRKRVGRITGCLWLLFLIYLLILLDFTLADESLGRTLFRAFDWNEEAYSDFFTRKTNLIPFATIRLFVHAYRKGTLSLIPVAENLLGNLIAFMPFSFFLPCFFAGCGRRRRVFGIVLIISVIIEILQFLLMTGSPDIDDVFLNAAGAWLAGVILKNRGISRGLSKLTFGVWKERKQTV